MNQYVLEVEKLYKTFQMGNVAVEILKDVNLKVKKGDFISVMGPSGSGKSTLLYLMGGLDNVTNGSVKVNGKQLSVLGDRDQSLVRRRDIGFVFQFYNLIPNLSVEENILLPILLDGKREKDYLVKVDELLEIVGLKDRRKHTPRELSGGQQQRTSIARALINDPDIILADEPTGNLDSKASEEILKLLKKINLERGKTIIMVTHSEEATKFGNRIVNLKDGVIFRDFRLETEGWKNVN